MVLRDIASRQAFKKAVFRICGTEQPTRSELRAVGLESARIAGRPKPWGGDHIYALLHGDRWPKYGIHPDLLEAVLKQADMFALNGKRKIQVYAGRVRDGAVVLGRSRRCARRRCGIHFVSSTPNQKYCSPECASRAAMARRRKNKC